MNRARLRSILICCCCLFGAVAQSPIDKAVFFLPSTKLKSYSAILKGRQPTGTGGEKNMMAAEQLGNHGNFAYTVSRRDENAVPEEHAAWNDICLPPEGEATLLYGGTIEGGREVRPGEIRGSAIMNGKTQKLYPGDVVVIPAGTPHQLLVDPGKSFFYLAFKVENK